MSTLAGVRAPDGDGRRDTKGATAEVEPLPRSSSEQTSKNRPGTGSSKPKSSLDAMRARVAQRPPANAEWPDLPFSPDMPPPKSREGTGRQFTVGNVGQNGMIFLKPVDKLPPRKTPTSPKAAPAEPSTVAATASPVSATASRRRSPLAGLPAVAAAAPPPPTNTSAGSRPPIGVVHQRSYSQSTIDARITQDKVEPEAMKLLAGRHDARIHGPAEANGEYPALSVSIPHYRLGSPRFSTMGTAQWRGSIYTMSSTTGEHHETGSAHRGLGGDFDRVLVPPTLEAHAVLSRRHSHASPQPYALHAAHGALLYNAIGAQAYAMPVATGPISPHMFDAIANDPHNPSIVQYSPINGEILAATPARLIAQITSDNFLDYELLSDFFLTVRSYLSTHDLLAYMLARFEWAINRFDDNGRVIRVRAFAALRHWILNYFSYDFVGDRELRVQLCDRLNALTSIVKARADYGASDLKLIADLKKCWKGRCSLYWETSPFPLDGPQDAEIHPCGAPGDNEGMPRPRPSLHFAQIAQVPPQLAMSPAQLTAGTPSIAKWYTTVMGSSTQSHARQGSGATARSVPMSPTSDQSAPVLSCSIPARPFRRALPFATRALGLHPVPAVAQARHQPARVAATGGHQASGSRSDIANGQWSAEGMEPSNDSANQLYPSSMLRGYGITPSSPFVAAIPTTPGFEIVSGFPQGGRALEQNRKGSLNNPAVKNILGNIRRALSSRYTPSSPSGSTPSTHASVPALGKSAQVPLNVTYQASPTGQPEQFRSSQRIDTLAKEAFEAYHVAINEALNQSSQIPDDIGVARGNESQQPSPFGFDDNQPNYEFEQGLRPPEFLRKASTMTDGSQSIVIVDDTERDAPPVPPIPPMPLLDTNVAHLNGEAEATPLVSPSTNQAKVPAFDKKLNHFGHPAEPFVFPLPPLNPNDTLQPPHTARPVRTTQASSMSLRRYASFQSMLSRSGPELSIDASSHTGDSQDPIPRAPARMLRRRPGGDLRANQNVHDLEDRTRPKSAGSITTYSESIRDSMGGSFGDRITRTFDMRRPSQRAAPSSAAPAPAPVAAPAGPAAPPPQRLSPVPTHSSLPEKRRPSFERAVAGLAHIPDDDEGGIEATLLKLEGKYKSPVPSPVQTRHVPARPNAPEPPSSEADDEPPKTPRHAAPPADFAQAGAPGAEGGPRELVTSALYAGSEASYNSVPLLERGADDEAQALAGTHGTMSIPAFPLETAPIAEPELRASTRRLRYASTTLTATTDSFLLDEDDFLSDLSSELSANMGEPNHPPEYAHEAPAMHDAAVYMGREHPPSPPMTMQHAMKITTQTDQARDQRKPPTPDTSPVAPAVQMAPQMQTPRTPKTLLVQGPGQGNEAQHMPFVLGFEAETLAQQFTLLEQEALKEVDWRDLVDMRWRSTATATTNWVDYLVTEDPIGVDLVTARFNLMVKWALSEIVLTPSVEERALTIMRYIHVAQQARRLHNYATLLQLTIALTSPDCTRLGRTWNRVPESEKEMLNELEMLVSPKKNFHNLRTEMEKVNADAGCIPVVALYTHDLIYNAQKPAQIPGPLAGGEPLINFERFRSTAVIVKNLLRLIDASTRYNFAPVPGLIDRCLWMSALPDETIAARSQNLAFA